MTGKMYTWKPEEISRITFELMDRRATLFYQQESSPRIGDYVLFPDRQDSPEDLHSYQRRYERISYDWTRYDGGYQTTPGGSFYLSDYGADCSGAFNDQVQVADLELTDETRKGTFWVFQNDRPCAGGGVEFRLDCRVYRFTGKDKQR